MTVCQEICLTFEELDCNAINYDLLSSTCTLTSLSDTSHGISLTNRSDHVYFRRFRCDGCSIINNNISIKQNKISTQISNGN